MFSKIKIQCTMKLLTGLHIGTENGFSAIGATDSEVIRDPYSGDPMIPGSSIKGKMRTLLAKSKQADGQYILPECQDDHERITRVFGTPKDRDGNPKTARLQFSDSFLMNKAELLSRGDLTEAKSENFITRSTSIANPRSIERVVRGAAFRIVWYYTATDENETRDDLSLLAEGCRLLSLDYLGGSGTRGYGRVRFDDFKLEIIGDMAASAEELLECFKDVSTYADQLL